MSIMASNDSATLVLPNGAELTVSIVAENKIKIKNELGMLIVPLAFNNLDLVINNPKRKEAEKDE